MRNIKNVFLLVGLTRLCACDGEEVLLAEEEVLLAEEEVLLAEEEALLAEEEALLAEEEALLAGEEALLAEGLEQSLDLEILTSPLAAPTFVSLAVGGGPLFDVVPLKGLKYFKFSMTQGKHYTVKMNYFPWNNDWTRDPDLYTHSSSGISTTNWLCRPFLGPGQSEQCGFTAPWTGTNYAMVHGFTEASYSIAVTSP